MSSSLESLYAITHFVTLNKIHNVPSSYHIVVGYSASQISHRKVEILLKPKNVKKVIVK